MSDEGLSEVFTEQDYDRLERVTDVLLPGDDTAPAASDLPELRELLERAVRAVGPEASVVQEALALLPAPPTWESLERLDGERPDLFEVLSAVAAGAYFMAPRALDAIGYPHGPRKQAPRDQIVDELETGVLDPVIERPPLLREVSA